MYDRICADEAIEGSSVQRQHELDRQVNLDAGTLKQDLEKMMEVPISNLG